MNEIIKLILSNIEMLGFGIILFMCAYIGNMLLGAWRNVKIEGQDFDWVLIANSLIKFVVLGLGIVLVSSTIAIIPMYAMYVGIEIDPSVLETLNSLAIIGAFLTATVKYAVDGVNKIREILGV